MNRERFGALPLGELHPEDRCALCGTRGEFPELKRIVLLSTHAQAFRCADQIACIRRRREARS